MKKIFGLFLVLVMAAMTTAGCETWKGFGEDMEKAGEEIQES